MPKWIKMNPAAGSCIICAWCSTRTYGLEEYCSLIFCRTSRISLLAFSILARKRVPWQRLFFDLKMFFKQLFNEVFWSSTQKNFFENVFLQSTTKNDDQEHRLLYTASLLILFNDKVCEESISAYYCEAPCLADSSITVGLSCDCFDQHGPFTVAKPCEWRWKSGLECPTVDSEVRDLDF